MTVITSSRALIRLLTGCTVAPGTVVCKVRLGGRSLSVIQEWNVVVFSVTVVAGRFVTEADIDSVAIGTYISISCPVELRVTSAAVTVRITGT